MCLPDGILHLPVSVQSLAWEVIWTIPGSTVGLSLIHIFYKLVHQAVREGNFGWSWTTDLGANFIASYSFYNPVSYTHLEYSELFCKYHPRDDPRAADAYLRSYYGG